MLESFSLKEKVAVVTGGAGLLGRQHVTALLQAGARVAALDVNAGALEELREACGKYAEHLHCEKADITKESEVRDVAQSIAERFGASPNVLVNNAAIDAKFDQSDGVPASRLEGFSIEQWNIEIAVGLTGSLICSKVFGAAMAREQGGVILNIASDLGVIAPDQRLYRQPGVADAKQPVKPVTYSVIKHGLIGLTRYLATYWAEQNVRCNAFAPGGVFNNHPDEFVNRLKSLIPMGRMAQVDEYQAAVVFLCSDASSYMNGATLNMDGGRSAW